MTKGYGDKITAQAWWETQESCHSSLKERVKLAKPETGGLLGVEWVGLTRTFICTECPRCRDRGYLPKARISGA